MHRLWLLFAQTVTVLVAGFFVLSTLRPEWFGKASEGRVNLTLRRVTKPSTLSA